ncbi:MAG: hypothetical protein VYA55_17605 [Pseudomonadota bacterium]|nr:hypothetical protein [Pseudomonadota bacterium]
MDMNFIFGMITVVAFVSAILFGAYQYKQAKDNDAKLEQAKASLKELEEGLLLSDYKLRKAIEYYECGHYKNALEVFRKYSNESEDMSEFKEVIRSIFWSETKKIYAKYMGKEWSTEILIMTILSKSQNTDTKYPSFMNDLFDIYELKSESKLSFWYIPILLNQGEYQKALNYIDSYKALAINKMTNDSFRDFLRNYCNRQITEV